MIGDHRPLCHIVKSFTEPKIFELLKLDPNQYFEAFQRISAYWNKTVPHGERYLLCASEQFGVILTSPTQWERVCCYLADSVMRVYRNGSDQFVHLVPRLISEGIVTTEKEFIEGIDLLIDKINPLGRGEHRYLFAAILMKRGILRTIDDIKNYDFSNVPIQVSEGDLR